MDSFTCEMHGTFVYTQDFIYLECVFYVQFNNKYIPLSSYFSSCLFFFFLECPCFVDGAIR